MTIRKINGNTYQEIAVVGASDSPLPVAQGFGIPEHDYVANTYTGTNLTQVVYRRGGAGGAIVATLALTYDGSGNLLTIAKS